MSELTRDEFEGWMKLLREDVQGVHTRLDLLNGRTRENERDIAVLKSKTEDLESKTEDLEGAQTKDPAARWTAFGSVLAAIGAGVYAWFHR